MIEPGRIVDAARQLPPTDRSDCHNHEDTTETKRPRGRLRTDGNHDQDAPAWRVGHRRHDRALAGQGRRHRRAVRPAVRGRHRQGERRGPGRDRRDVTKILVPDGETVAVGTPVAEIDAEGGAAAAERTGRSGTGRKRRPPKSPRQPEAAADAGAEAVEEQEPAPAAAEAPPGPEPEPQRSPSRRHPSLSRPRPRPRPPRRLRRAVATAPRRRG